MVRQHVTFTDRRILYDENNIRVRYVIVCQYRHRYVVRRRRYCDEFEMVVNSSKYLGLYIDDDLNWKNHIQYIYGKLLRLQYIL